METSVNISVGIINSNKNIATNVLVAVVTAPIFHPQEGNVWDRVLMDNTLQCIQISVLPVVHMDSISHFVEIDALGAVDMDSMLV